MSARSLAASAVSDSELCLLQSFVTGIHDGRFAEVLATISEGIRYGHTVTVIVGDDLYTEMVKPEVLDAFRKAWAIADDEGDVGNRVHRGMIAAVQQVTR